MSPSLEEQIYTASVIVRATLVSATAATRTVPSEDAGVAPTYRPFQILRFTVHEYLKGTGPSEILVYMAGGHNYLTEAKAQREARIVVYARNTNLDQRQGVLFLFSVGSTDALTLESVDGTWDGAQSASVQTYRFALSNSLESAWDYTVDYLSRAWLPAGQVESDDQASNSEGADASLFFITDGSESPPPMISLEELKTRIAEFAATMKAGEGVAGYYRCIEGKILRERYRRAAITPWGPSKFEKSLLSGATIGTKVFRGTSIYQEPEYSNWWLSGPNADLFQARIVDDDSSPSNGYHHALVTARPLPDGIYRVHYNMQHYAHIPCNSKPEDAYDDWKVTVTPPPGTLHEAFFDPVALASGVGASGSAGVLEPDSFSMNGTDTTISGLRWDKGSVVLTLSPYTALSRHKVDFIALDGSVSLSLDTDSATGNSSAGTLAWSVESRPWQAGDLLMLRISEDDSGGVDPTPTPVPTPTP